MTSITDVHKIDLVYYAILLKRFSFIRYFRLSYTDVIISIIAKHSIPSTPAKTVTFISRTITLEFTSRQNSHYQIMKTQQRGVFVMQIRRCLNDTI